MNDLSPFQSFVWTSQAEDRLRELWAAGATCSTIARAVGTSKGSVTGKIFRLGLEQRYRSPVSRPKKPRAKQPRVRTKPTRTLKQRPVKPRQNPFKVSAKPLGPTVPMSRYALAWEPLPAQKPVPMLENTGCKWPIGEWVEPWLCCGGKLIGEGPYCGAHTVMATL